MMIIMICFVFIKKNCIIDNANNANANANNNKREHKESKPDLIQTVLLKSGSGPRGN